MFLQLASGMKHINSILVHRDIKPDNILIVDDVLKITDFGLAKYAEATTRSVTFKGYGTKEYCAPEVCKNEKNTIYMDIYSMGIVFYEIATLKYRILLQAGIMQMYICINQWKIQQNIIHQLNLNWYQ